MRPHERDKVHFHVRRFTLPICLRRNPSILSASVRTRVIQVYFIRDVAVRTRTQRRNVLRRKALLRQDGIALVGTRLTVGFVSKDRLTMCRPVVCEVQASVRKGETMLFPLTIFPSACHGRGTVALILLRGLLPYVLQG